MTDEMKEDIKKYLKDNLSIEVDVNVGWMSYSDYRSVRVITSLLLDGEVISTSENYDTIPNDD